MLVDRYCDAVVDDGVEIDRLLAFTFTERAAAEMRATRPQASSPGARARRAREATRARAERLLASWRGRPSAPG